MADPTLDPLAWALKALRDDDRQGGYRAARRYYDGDHPMMFATDKFKSTFGKTLSAVADNLCPAVVDSVADRLKVTGVEPGVGPDGKELGSAELATQAWGIWQRNRMDVRAPETHREALLTGDAFVLVWPNAANEAVMWPLEAGDVVVSYDPNEPGVLRRAARVWQDDDDGLIHVDVYFRDRVNRYVTDAPKRAFTSSLRPTMFVPYDRGGFDVAGVEPNPLGVVPIVHFPNQRFHGYGVSELKDVPPLQDALNKTVCDLLVSNEFAAFRQRWATGYDLDNETTGNPSGNVSSYGVDRMLTSSDENTRFGNFDASEAQGFLETMENFRAEIARVSGTPLHYLFITRGDFPSGEAMKSAEARFTIKVEQRQASFGNKWEDLLAIACRIEGADDKTTGAMLSAVWESAEPSGLTTPPAAGPPPNEPPAPAGTPDPSSSRSPGSGPPAPPA